MSLVVEEVFPRRFGNYRVFMRRTTSKILCLGFSSGAQLLACVKDKRAESASAGVPESTNLRYAGAEKFPRAQNCFFSALNKGMMVK